MDTVIGSAPPASPGATTMAPAKVRSRFAARSSSANRAEPQRQTISGRPGSGAAIGQDCMSTNRE